MKSVVGAMLVTVLIGLLLANIMLPDERSPAADETARSGLESQVSGLAARVGDHTTRLAALERAFYELPPPAPERLIDLPGAEVSGNLGVDGERDPQWYLDQYVRSFELDGEGSEYLRINVEHRVSQLLRPIGVLLRETWRPVPLRAALVRMLGKGRFRGDVQVLEILLGVLGQMSPRELARDALTAITRLADQRAVAALEAVVWELREDDLLFKEVLRALVGLGGGNVMVARLIAACADEVYAAFLLSLLDPAERDVALSVFRAAQQSGPPVRLAAAEAIGEHREPDFIALVEEWLDWETDAQVREALEEAGHQQKSIPAWHALQAVGPPDADPHRDDPNAWAPAGTQMSEWQWLELEYADPDRVVGFRVHEVSSPGALAEVHGRDESGALHLLWKGASPSSYQGPFDVEIVPTSYRVRALRLWLDTQRAAGYNEIDAVMLIGVGGTQWAVGASASTSYGQ